MRAIILMLMLLTAALVSAQNLNDESLRITVVNQEPDPVGPGEYVDVRLQVENLGNVAVDGVVVEFVPSFPFSIDPGQNQRVEIGTLSAFQNQNRAFIVKYKVRVSDDAIEGANDLKIKAKKADGSWSNYVFSINVRTSDANLAIESITTTPKEVEPGKDATVTIMVKNMADSPLRDVSMNLDLGLSTISTTANLDLLPFATLESGTEKRITQLNPGQEAYFTYNLRAYPSAESRVYKIPVQLTYRDDLNTEYTKNSLIGLVVNSQPDVTAVLDSSEVTMGGQTGEVTIKFVNKGLTDIKFVNVQLGSSDEYEILSPHEVYIGNIDSDDYETADYDLHVTDNVQGNLMLPITYTFMDANNNEYNIDQDIELRLYTMEDEERFGNSSQNPNALYWVLGIAVIVVAFIIWRVYKRKRA